MGIYKNNLSLLAHTLGTTYQHPIKLDQINGNTLKKSWCKRPKRRIRNELCSKDPLKFSSYSKKIPAFLFRHTTHIKARQVNCHNTLPLLVLLNPLYEIIIKSHILLRGTQSIWVMLNSLCHSPKLNGRYKKIWSIVALSIHNKQTNIRTKGFVGSSQL